MAPTGKEEELENELGRWSKEEDALLKKAVSEIGARNWKRVSSEFLAGKRTDVQCLHRWQKVLKPGLIKGPWTGKFEFDLILFYFVLFFGGFIFKHYTRTTSINPATKKYHQ